MKSLHDAMLDPDLFRRRFGGPTLAAWRPAYQLMDYVKGLIANSPVIAAELPHQTLKAISYAHPRASRNSLLIEDDVALDQPSGMSVRYADMQTTNYRRSFHFER